MPNGRGTIDCCYCLHWSITEEEWGYASGQYDGQCNCWDVAIPRSLTEDHRFCLDFTPSKYFGEDNGVGHPEESRSAQEIAWERLKAYLQTNPGLRIGVLYHASYVNMEGAQELMRLDGSEDSPEKTD